MRKTFAALAFLLGTASLSGFASAETPGSGSTQSIGVPQFQGRPASMPPPGSGGFRGDDLGNHNAQMPLNMNQNRIVNVTDPINPDDAVTLEYLNDAIGLSRNIYPVAPANPKWETTRVKADIGDGWPSVTDVNMVAIGMNAKASDQATNNSGGSIAIGSNAKAYGLNGVALGAFSTVGEFDATNTATKRAVWGIAIGTRANSVGQESMAIGRLAVSLGYRGVAIGAATQAPMDHSVALGSGSVTTQNYTLSLGSTTVKRRIVNVANGVDPNDAVTVAQMNGAIGAAPTNVLAGDGISVASGNVVSVNNTVLRTSGNQIVDGLKVFRTVPQGQTDPVTNNDLVRLSYLNARIRDAYTGGNGITVSNAGVIAVDSTVVNTETRQDIGGTKIFTSVPKSTEDPSANLDLVRLSYLNGRLSTFLVDRGYFVPNNGGLVINNAARQIRVDETVVRTSGNQHIKGRKVFADYISLAVGEANEYTQITNISQNRIHSLDNFRLMAGAARDVPQVDLDGNPTGTVYSRPFGASIDINGDSDTPSITFLINGVNSANRFAGGVMGIDKDRIEFAREIRMRRGGQQGEDPGPNIIMEGGRVVSLGNAVDGFDAANLNVVRFEIQSGAVTLTRNQTIDGNKTFTNTVRAPSYVQTSDARLKTDVREADFLDKVLDLRPVTFKWIESGEPAIGFIAQDVEKIFPELVKTDEDGMKAVDYASMVSPLVSTVQDLHGDLEETRAEMEGLKERLDRLEAAIAE